MNLACNWEKLRMFIIAQCEEEPLMKLQFVLNSLTSPSCFCLTRGRHSHISKVSSVPSPQGVIETTKPFIGNFIPGSWRRVIIILITYFSFLTSCKGISMRTTGLQSDIWTRDLRNINTNSDSTFGDNSFFINIINSHRINRLVGNGDIRHLKKYVYHVWRQLSIPVQQKCQACYSLVCFLGLYFDPEEERSTFLRKTCKMLPGHTVLHPRL
jgi:hypothetical protein